MIKTIKKFKDVKNIAGNVAKAARKYLCENSVVRQGEEHTFIQQQKKTNWLPYID